MLKKLTDFGSLDGGTNPGSDNPENKGSGFSGLTPSNRTRQSESSATPTTPAQNQQKRRKPIQKKFSIQEVLKVLYRGRWVILTTFMVVFAYGVYKAYSEPFVYASGTRMFIDKGPIKAEALGFQVSEDHSIANQIQFFKSHVVAQHVAKLIHQHATGDRTEIDSLFTEYFGSTNAVPPDPRQLSVTRIEDNPKKTHIPGLADVGTIEARVAGATNIIPDGSNDYLIVTTEAFTPLDAAFIANTYVVVFAKDNLARTRSNSANLKAFLQKQMRRSYDTLHDVELRLRNYLRASNGMSIELRANELLTQYEQTKVKHANLMIELAQLRKTYTDLTGNLDTVQQNYFKNLTLEPIISMLQSELASAQVDLVQMLASNPVMDPRTKKYLRDDIRAKEERIATVNARLKEKAQELLSSQVVVATPEGPRTSEGSASSITRLRETILATQLKIGQSELVQAELEKLMDKLQTDLALMPEKVVEAARLKRAQGSAERLYGQLEDKYMDAWLAEQSAFGNVKVEDPAIANASPIRPNRQANIFSGALMGLAIGIGLVLLLSFLDSTIRSPEEIETNGLSVLGTIPVIQDLGLDLKEEIREGAPKFSPHRITAIEPRSSISESYRSLRTAIQFAGLARDVKSIVVTSSVPQEGKSTTSSNIAIVMAQTGRSTLLVDTDLRRPVVHTAFDIPREPGLTNVLFDRITLEDAVVKSDIPNLYLLPCGIIPPNPAELLGSDKMRKLYQKLYESYDMIIFDTPPVVAVTDSLILGAMVDGVLLIARGDVTKSDALLRSADAIDRSGARLLGTVLNNFNVANAYGAYYRYYQYYNYYSADMPQKKTAIDRIRTVMRERLRLPV